MSPIPPAMFLAYLLPWVKRGDAQGVKRMLQQRGWRERDIAGLLRQADREVRTLAARVLGSVGEASALGSLAGALRDEDEAVAVAAADAMWSIWMRGGRAEAQGPLRRGVAMIGSEHYAGAVEPLEQAVEVDPDFAEAHHQLGLAWALLERWSRALPCFARAAGLCRTHFGAIAAVGHVYAQSGRLAEALVWYRRALAINPRLVEVAHAVRAIEASRVEAQEEVVAVGRWE